MPWGVGWMIIKRLASDDLYLRKPCSLKWEGIQSHASSQQCLSTRPSTLVCCPLSKNYASTPQKRLLIWPCALLVYDPTSWASASQGRASVHEKKPDTKQWVEKSSKVFGVRQRARFWVPPRGVVQQQVVEAVLRQMVVSDAAKLSTKTLSSPAPFNIPPKATYNPHSTSLPPPVFHLSRRAVSCFRNI